MAPGAALVDWTAPLLLGKVTFVALMDLEAAVVKLRNGLDDFPALVDGQLQENFAVLKLMPLFLAGEAVSRRICAFRWSSSPGVPDRSADDGLAGLGRGRLLDVLDVL